VAKALLEKDEQKLIFKWWFKQYPKFDMCLFSSLNGISLGGSYKQRSITINSARAQGMLNGVSDIQLCVARGGYHGMFIELKRSNGKESNVTPCQWSFIYAMREQGYYATWCAGHKQAIELITDYMEGRLEK
jgi:hypothetical protein